jgi:hypothetical protein
LVSRIPPAFLEVTGLNGAMTFFAARRFDAGSSTRSLLRAVARLLERDHGGGRPEVVVDDLDGRQRFKRREPRRPAGPGRAGVNTTMPSFAACR